MANRSIDKASEQKFQIAPEGRKAQRLISCGFLGNGAFVRAFGFGGVAPKARHSRLLLRPELLPTKEAVRLREALQAVELTRPDGVVLKNAGLRSFAERCLITKGWGWSHLAAAPMGRFCAPTTALALRDRSRGAGDARLARFHWPQQLHAHFHQRRHSRPHARHLSVDRGFCPFVSGRHSRHWRSAGCHLAMAASARQSALPPFADPALCGAPFISILVFRGLFNQNFGEINLVLEALFGIRPEWFTDGTLALAMIVIVNLWLGSQSLHDAAGDRLLAGGAGRSEEGGGAGGVSARRIFFTLTLPQIWPPFLPMLISSFAFNFNRSSWCF